MRARWVAAGRRAAARAALRRARAAGEVPFSSAYWFDGWKGRVRLREARQRELLNVPRPAAEPTVWLLTTGWRRWGPLGFDEVAKRG